MTATNGEPNKSTYFARKIGINYNFNYNLAEMINNFSFTEFLATNTHNEHGGIVVITNNQYIIGYTEGFGTGSHRVAFARVMKDLTGGGDIRDYEEADRLSKTCKNNFLTARILYDYRGDNEYGTPQYSGAIYLELPQGETITPDQFEAFKRFYEDYNKELEIIIRQKGIKKFNIQYGFIDADGTKAVRIVDSLDEVYRYLETRIDPNKVIIDTDEPILGVPTKNTGTNGKKKK